MGTEVLERYERNFRYGNAHFSSDSGFNNGLERAWVASSLQVSPKNRPASCAVWSSGRCQFLERRTMARPERPTPGVRIAVLITRAIGAGMSVARRAMDIAGFCQTDTGPRAFAGFSRKPDAGRVLFEVAGSRRTGCQVIAAPSRMTTFSRKRCRRFR